MFGWQPRLSVMDRKLLGHILDLTSGMADRAAIRRQFSREPRLGDVGDEVREAIKKRTADNLGWPSGAEIPGRGRGPRRGTWL